MNRHELKDMFGGPRSSSERRGNNPNEDWEYNKQLWYLTEQGLNKYFESYPGLEGRVATQPDLTKSMNNIVAEVVGIGGKILVRNKVNQHDCGTFVLELWSTKPKAINNFKGKVGWPLDLTLDDDYVSFLYEDTQFFCVLPFPLLRTTCIEAFPLWKQRFPPNLQLSGSECMHVPRELVVTTMAKVAQSHGNLAEGEEWLRRALTSIRKNQAENIQTIARNYKAAVGRLAPRNLSA